MTYSIFTTQTPAESVTSSGFTVGLTFTVDGLRQCTAGRYYKDASRNGDTVQMGLWKADGTLIATGSRTQLTGDTGWVTVSWTTPLNIHGTYLIGYLVPSGRNYQRTPSGLTSGITNPPFVVPSGGGRFLSSGTLGVPTSTSNNLFFADVVVGEDLAGYLPAPRYATMGPHRTANVIGKGAGSAPPKTSGQIWPRGKR